MDQGDQYSAERAGQDTLTIMALLRTLAKKDAEIVELQKNQKPPKKEKA